jgi:uncharacterized membrane protein YozB (DUF420 family)
VSVAYFLRFTGSPLNLPLLAFSLQDLPAVNAVLNATATLLLITGFLLIKQGREQAHKWVMLTAFVVSCLFLGCYLAYHFDLKSRTGASGVPFGGGPPISYAYYTMLLTHVLLAATVPFLALTTIYFGLKNRRVSHRRIARWTFPIWLYVSVTGVVIYVMLYHLYPPPASKFIIPEVAVPAGATQPIP